MASEPLTVAERERTPEATPLRQPAVPREHPVFADLSGRRARLFRLVGRALVVILLLWLAAVGAGLAGLGALPVVPNVGGSERGAESESPGSESPSAGTTPGARSGASASGSSAGPREPAQSSGDGAEIRSPAADTPARARQPRRDAAPPRRLRGTPPARELPRSTPPAPPQRSPATRPPGPPAEPPAARRPSPPATPQQGPPPHSQAPASPKGAEQGQGRGPRK